MPQLDTSTFISQIFWLIISFSSLYFIVSKFITPKMDEVLNKRHKIIDEHINKANSFKEKASMLFEQYQISIDNANEEAAENSRKAIEELKIFIREKTALIQKELSENSDKMKKSIQKDKEQAIAEIDNVIEDLTNTLSSKIGLKA